MSAPSQAGTRGVSEAAPRPATAGPDAEGPIGPCPPLVVGRCLGTVTVTLHGDLGPGASAGLAWVLQDLIEGQGNLAVVVDVGDVGGIDGSGVEVVAFAARSMSARGGDLRLARPNGAVLGALAVAGLAGLVSSPPEQGQRSWSPGHRAGASRLVPTGAHPAGSGGFEPDQQRHGCVLDLSSAGVASKPGKP